MGEGKPAAVDVFFKQRSDPMHSLRFGVHLGNPSEDSDGVLAGIQNEGFIEAPFDPTGPKYDLFYRALNEGGEGELIQLKRTTFRSSINQVGGLNTTDVSFVIADPGAADAFQAGDPIRIGNELMVVLSYVDGTKTITVEERGAHGTAAAAHLDGATVILSRFTVPHNSIALSAFSDSGKPGAAASFILFDATDPLGNGIGFSLEKPTTNFESIFGFDMQFNTTLWALDLADTTNLKGILAQGTDGTITQGGSTLTTTVTLNTAWANKVIYTHEGINLTTGEIDFPIGQAIDTLVDNGDGTWTVNLRPGATFKLKNGAQGVTGEVNFIIADGWQTEPADNTVFLEPFLGPVWGKDNFQTQGFVKTAEAVFARGRWHGYHGFGPWIYWDGTSGSTVRANAVTFTPTKMNAALALIGGAAQNLESDTDVTITYDKDNNGSGELVVKSGPDTVFKINNAGALVKGTVAPGANTVAMLGGAFVAPSVQQGLVNISVNTSVIDEGPTFGFHDSAAGRVIMGGFKESAVNVRDSYFFIKIQNEVAGDLLERMHISSDGHMKIVGAGVPAASAALDIETTGGALLVPRMTTTQRDALTAGNGMIIYNTTTNQMEGRVNGAWVAL